MSNFIFASGPIDPEESVYRTNEGLTLYEDLKKGMTLPVDLYPFQQYAVNALGVHDRWGLYFDVGTGKTFTSICIALIKMKMGWLDKVLVVMPPVLLPNWKRTLDKFPGVASVIYAGTPSQRKAIPCNAQFVLVGAQIFKKDNDELVDKLGGGRILTIVDEAQMIKNPASGNYKTVSAFAVNSQLGLLTGTPLSLPTDAYAYVQLITPGIYKSQYQFESIHVSARDFRERPTEYANLEMLKHNLLLQSHRVLKEDVLKDLPEITYTPLYYDLDPKHLKLYQQLAEERMAKLENGDKIDLTNASALFQALQQIPCSAEHFSGGTIRSTVLDLVDQVLDEIGDEKLVIFCHYRRTTERLLGHLKRLNAVALYGDTGATQRQKNLDQFVEDPECRVIILQFKSGGAGIDNLQNVCSDILMVELPYRAADLRQATARLHRDGQTRPVTCRIAIAEKTLQVKLWEYVQDNDSLVNTVIRGPIGIREAINGK